MMSLYSYDNITIVGKVGRDAEMRFMPNGDPVTAFSVAVDRSYKKDGENIKRTIWYKVSVFGKFAEVCKDIKKGNNVFVSGDLQADWSTGSPKIFQKQDGGHGASFEVTAQIVRFLSPKSESANTAPIDEAPF
jgi:single-strand DNA-binding protein